MRRLAHCGWKEKKKPEFSFGLELAELRNRYFSSEKCASFGRAGLEMVVLF